MLTDQVYTVCKKIPQGKVTTHKEIAKALNTKAYQAIDQALKRNPYAPEVPCHRVVSSTGNLHGFKGKRNGKAIEEKKYLLKKEGIEIKNNKIDLKKYLFSFH
ncbi:MAG: methylated-DNA-[protein]-cysteine S-methyltransferase [archaeon GW2011_AR17]|nr:MAG: methylated-DNA-[protein]-cysteine S-methyltransferase [archaeon GW2011_AR17]MBS3154691.1 MGMT family protein [Candidatus Woesearchaeota archaeon]HIH14984.1 MGMT family protein [Nanoarchaeota archaeon]HIH58789.1 MGMT family protein [Nanoarchaeota archaeon]HII13520.1 MGMT family protein [Nanoarchaeota archaeon]